MKLIIAISLIILSGAASAKFYDGQMLFDYAQEYHKADAGKANAKYNKLPAGVFLGYVAGIIDSYGDEGAKVFCQPNGRLQTYADVVYKYLNENPERRVNSAESLVIEAMQSSYRCKEPPKWMSNK